MSFDSYHIETLVKALSLVYFTICVNLLLPHIILIQICHKFGMDSCDLKKGNAEFSLPETRVHLEVTRNRGLTFINSCFSNFDAQLFHGTTDMDPRMGRVV